MASRLESWIDGLRADAARLRDGIAKAWGRTRAEIDPDDALLRQMLAQMAASGILPSGGAAAGGHLPIVLTVNLPVSPSVLTEMLLAGDKTQSLGTPGLFKFSTTVNAGGSTTVTIPNPTNAIILFISSLDISSNYYGTGILLYATVDGQPITAAAGTTFDYQVTSADSVMGVLYTYVESAVVLTITNNTSTDATLTFKLENFTMDRDTWLTYWIPLVRGGVAATRRVAGQVA